jgi:hypothetical protein
MPQEREDIIFGVIKNLHDNEAEPDTVIGVRALVDNRVRVVLVTLEAVIPHRTQMPRESAAAVRRSARNTAHPIQPPSNDDTDPLRLRRHTRQLSDVTTSGRWLSSRPHSSPLIRSRRPRSLFADSRGTLR